MDDRTMGYSVTAIVQNFLKISSRKRIIFAQDLIKPVLKGGTNASGKAPAFPARRAPVIKMDIKATKVEKTPQFSSFF